MRIDLKKILLMLITFGMLSSANTSHVRWFSDFETAHKEALKQNKNLMVFLMEKECSDCKNTLISTFMNQTYIDIINEKFIPILVIKEQKSSYPIEMLYTNEYPAIFFLNKYELFSCDVLKGRISPESFKAHLEECKN